MLYTGRDQLTILELKNGEGNVCIKELNRLLVEQPSNMVYCENAGKLVGIISAGDICRAYEKGQHKVMVNKEFTCLNYGEYMKAKKIFKEEGWINALPVVAKDGILLGDYTRWDDLLVLDDLIGIDIEQCIEECRKWKNVLLVQPSDILGDKRRIFKRFEESLKSKSVTPHCIVHSEVFQFMENDNLILFVDQNEIRTCFTRMRIMYGNKYDGYDNLKTYRAVFNKELNFSDDDCALYLKRLQNKGVRIIGLMFEETEYYKQLMRKIEDRFTSAGEAISNILPKCMYKEFFDDLYNESYADSIFNMPIDYENNGGVCSLKDCRSQYYNVVNGERYTADQPSHYTKSIYFFGQCYIYGHYVEDKNTIESLLQENICSNGWEARVVNCGSLNTNSAYRYLPRIIGTQLKRGDIIVIDQPPKGIPGVYYLDLCRALEENDVKVEWMVDKIWHCNHKINKIYADAIYHMLIPILQEKVEKLGELVDKDEDFIKFLYFDRYFANFDSSKYKKIGSIVMNCNPFTQGHRYLIEQALEIVDFLIIFVVEQDKSFFSFSERFAIVRKGVEDLKNVMVVPSGPFMASQMTVPEYFNKQMTENAAEHDEQDSAIFAQKIARPLGIRYRFFGEEPFDEVTNQYNIASKKILPLYGIEAVIIPRKKVNGKDVSASTVRKFLGGECEQVDEMLPKTTKAMLGL